MLRIPWLCLLLAFVSLSSVRLAAKEATPLFRTPEQVTFFRPAGHAWIFFQKRAKIFWLEDSEHTVFSAKELSAPRLLLRRILHPYSHHIQPWSGAHRNIVLKD